MIDRRWVSPQEPLLAHAAQWLVTENAVSGGRDRIVQPGDFICDLSRVVCVLRGRRAGRLFLHELLDAARAHDKSLIPPLILTQGGLVERFLEQGQPVASEPEQTLAWMEALRLTPADEIAPLAPEAPAAEDWQAWHRLAQTIASLHRELAGEDVSFEHAADVADAIDHTGDEGRRWRTLANVFRRYHAALSNCGLVDPHVARQQARSREAPAIERPDATVLIGVVELNAVQRAAIEVAAAPVTSFVHADESMRDGFDEFGCVVPSYWQSRCLPLDRAAIVVADRPSDQAQEVMRALASLNGECAADDVIIGVGDDRLRSAIERAAMWADVRVHDSEGTLVRMTPAARLLEAAAAYLAEPRFAHFASLLRHPDLGAWLERTLQKSDTGVIDWLSLLDCYFTDHLQRNCADEWLGDRETAGKLRQVYMAVNTLLQPCAGAAKPIGAWMGPIAHVLGQVYGDAEATTESLRASGAMAIMDAMAELAAVHPQLQPAVPAMAAIRLLLREVGNRNVPEPPRRDAVEMIGWLELHPDPASVLVLAGVNDGSIPATTTANPFLPDSLRARLGLACNRTRYARDAYFLDVMLRSGRQVTLITGRRSADGEPLTPSRLLLARPDAELPARILEYCRDLPPPGLPVGSPAPAAASRFTVPVLSEIEPPAYLYVTDFKTYLECPYRFALKRLLRLDVLTDRVTELDAMQFGTVAHEVLCGLGDGDALRDETDAKRLTEFLLDRLHDHVRREFGSSPLPAVQVQVAQLEQRLRSFALFQAEARREGWRIEHCEYRLGEGSVLDVPGDDPMPVHGKIDRIDRHERTGAWRIIDYKTGDKGDGPIEQHHGRSKLPGAEETEWRDLQLPLYRYLAAKSGLGIEGNVELGFIVLPRQTDGVAWKCAPWTDAHIASAIEQAREVVRLIRGRMFELNPDYPSRFDPFARICQTMVVTSDDAAESEVAL